MMRKNVKRAVPSANGGMSSRTMYRSRTRNLTALLYHSDVHRLSQLLAVALVLAALAGLGDAVFGASGVPDRLDRFRELALTWQGRVQTGAELTADAYREMYALLDEEIVESLTSGGPYASPGFLQDRLDAFGGVWGGTTLGVVGVDHLVVGAFQLADATDVNTVRVYGRLHGEAEDLYRLVPDTGAFARTSRTYHQPWHRELHATVWRLFEALGGGDQATLAELVPDATLRRRLPATLRAEPACDAPEGGPIPRTVSVAASEARAPWELVFQRTARGWRLTRATQVLP